MNASEIKNLWRDVDPFTKAYIECARAEDNDTPLDERYCCAHLTIETLEKMVVDCKRFQAENPASVADELVAAESGYCFWLSRNGHGSGFFDSNYFDEASRENLQAAAEKFGECILYVGDDGKLYLQ